MEVKNGNYRHHKGNIYCVIGVAKHTEDDCELVVYHPLGNKSKLFARPKEMFLEYLEDKKMNRFTRID